MSESRVEQWKRRLLDLFSSESAPECARFPEVPAPRGDARGGSRGGDGQRRRAVYATRGRFCPIDIAVKDPDDPARYILGIECDGVNYASQKTMRDRDILREDVLRGLHWKMYRAWSVDWVLDRRRAETRLLEVLQATENSGDK